MKDIFGVNTSASMVETNKLEPKSDSPVIPQENTVKAIDL